MAKKSPITNGVAIANVAIIDFMLQTYTISSSSDSKYFVIQLITTDR